MEVRVRLLVHQHDSMCFDALAQVSLRGKDEHRGSCGDALVEWVHQPGQLYMPEGKSDVGIRLGRTLLETVTHPSTAPGNHLRRRSTIRDILDHSSMHGVLRLPSL